jgi:ATP-dependent RNA helicase SUPV3L1/SUV3
VERATQKPCCVVYGALPPETRAQQAKLFNEPGSGYDVLVASDAIGMGLNLNIRRVVFHTLEKFNGELMNNIPASLIKQIAGRAGRRGSLYPEGLVTTFHLSDLPHLQLCLEQPFVDACNAGLFPSCEQLQIFADHMPNVKFSELLERFIETSRVDAYYFLCKNKDLMKIASVIDTVDSLTLEERFTFCFSPVSARDAKSVGALLHYARSYSKRIPLQLLIGRPSSSPAIDFQLMDLEDKYKLISLYLWLSQHFPPELFPDKQEGENMSMAIAQMLGQSLTDLHKSTG